MNADWIIFFIMSSVLVPMMIAFALGKGAFLLAGYNTASKTEQATYDEKKLCHCAAILFLCIEICIAIQCLTPIPSIGPMIILIPAIVITMIYANTKCKKGK